MKIFILIILFLSAPLRAQNAALIKTIQTLSDQHFSEAVELRHELHQIPELGYNEIQTSAFAADYLKKLGLEVTTNIGGKRGIKAVLRTGRPGRVVGIRSDMDALPISEETGLSWSSTNSGVMHACGHDIHMTNVLIAARILTSVRDQLRGTVVFIFQPCEEGSTDGSPAGASMLVEAGILENPKIDAMFGLHVMPGYPIGTIAVKPGPIMANVATVRMTIKGRSSHGAYPHEGVDAVYAASSAVLQFQSIISRIKDPAEQAVLSIGKIKGGNRYNVIADKVEMEGTVRSFSLETESLIDRGMQNVLKGLSVSYGITYDYTFQNGSKFVKNDPTLTSTTTQLFKNILGNDNVFTTRPQTVGEDFSVYSHLVPSVFFFLGAGEEGALHHPAFAPDDSILKYGPLLIASAAADYLLK